MSTENDMPLSMPNGTDGVLLVSGKSNYEDRQNLASCLLSVLTEPAGQPDDDTTNNHGWTIAYIASVAKGLLDSMRLEDCGRPAPETTANHAD